MNRCWLSCAAMFALVPSAGEAGSVVGRVVDATGRAPVSVTIEVIACNNDLTWRANCGAASKTVTGTAAADGSFRIQLPPDWPPSEVRVSSAGSETLRPADLVSGGDDVDLKLLILSAAQTLNGIVRDEAGRPIAGAHVRAVGLNGRVDVLAGESLTDTSGRYHIPDAAERVAQMTVTHPAYVPQSAPRTRASWIMKEGGAIQGVVIDDQRQPVAGARVMAGGQSAVSTGLGDFKVTGLSPGTSHVVSSDREGRVAMTDVVVVDRETVSATLSLRPGPAVRGTIRDAANGRPMPWTRVHVYQEFASGEAGNRDIGVIANDSGTFRLSGLEPGQYTFEVQRSGYLRAVQSHTLMRAARSTDVELLLNHEARIEGRVTDNSDRPVAGARISVTESNPMQELARQLRAASRDAVVTYSDQDGRFVLRGLWPGRALRVEASATDFVPAHVDGIDLGVGAVRPGVNFILHGGAIATGVVTDQQDRPLANVQVYSNRIDDAGAMPAAVGMFQTRAPVAAVTDDQGRFVVSGLAQGRYFHTFIQQGYSRGFIPATHILAGTINELPQIKLAAAATIRGRVIDPQHRPVAGAIIYAIDRTLEVVSASSDANGEFEIANLTEGDEVSLQVDWERSAPERTRIRVPASGVTIQVSDGLTLRGRVYDATTSQPISDFTVERITRAPGTTTFRLGASAARPFHADDGSFELNRLAAGPCVLRVRSPGYLSAEISVPSLPAPDDVSVALVHGNAVTGRVLLAGNRQPVSNVTVTWRQGDGERAELEAMFSSLASAQDTAVTDADGRFVLPSVPAGSTTLFASHAEYAPTRLSVTIPARSGIELTMNPGGTIAGMVVLDQGGPAAGATVAFTPAGAHASMVPPDTVTTDASGRFRIGHLREGSYLLVARAPTGASPPYTVSIAGSEQRGDVVLTLRSGTTVHGSVRGLPIGAQSNIFVMVHGEDYYDSTFTDASGSFSLPHVPAGAVAVEATTSFRQGMTAGARVDVPENGPSTIEVDLDFSGQSELSGIVTRAGHPASSVVVNASPVLPSVTTRGRAESESDGTYRIAGLSDGRYQLVASGPFGLYRRTVDVQGYTGFDIDLPAGSIVGTVTDTTTHAPIADAVVTAASGMERSVADTKRTVTDSSGYYALTELDPGAYELRTTRSGYRQLVQMVSVQQSEQHRDVELQPHANLRLRIFDATSGAPASQAIIRITSHGVLAFMETLTLDNAGRGDIPELAPGDYLLTVLVAGYAPRSLPIQVPTAALDVSIEVGGRVQLRLPPGTSTRVRLMDAAGIAQAVRGSDPAGWTAIAGPSTAWPNVASGAYRVETMTGGVIPVMVKTGTTSVVEVK